MVTLVDKFAKGRVPDGFDFDAAYQMVPVADRREIFVETDTLAATLRISKLGIARMGNFRNADTLASLPSSGAGMFVDSFRVPPKTKAVFDVLGVTPGITFITGQDIPQGDDIEIDMTPLLVSVKPELERKFAFVLVNDLIRPPLQSGDFLPRFVLRSVKEIYQRQANIKVTEIDADKDMRQILVFADLQDPINIADPVIENQIDARLNQVFPGLFGQCDFIVYITWRVRGQKIEDNLLGINRQTQSRLNTVYIGPEPTDFGSRVILMAHEFGHAMGLPHQAERCLMFPSIGGMTPRLIAGFVEQLHVGPIFPGQ